MAPSTACSHDLHRECHEAIALAFRQSMTDHMRRHADGTNVNADTLLASDYLNQFAAFAMLLNVLPQSREEIADELLAWQPLDYAEHFARSGFRERALAVAAYENAPPGTRAAFDRATATLASEAERVLDRVRRAVTEGDAAGLAACCASAAPAMAALLDDAAAIVNGAHHPPPAPKKGTAVADGPQAWIDALFNRRHRRR